MGGAGARLSLAVVIALLATAAAALASVGALTPRGCIADSANNPDGCSKTAKGLDFVLTATVSHDGRSVYAAGWGDNAIARFKRNRTTGALTPKGCIADFANNPDSCGQTTKGLANVVALAVSSDGRSLYAVAENDNAIVRFNRNRTTGKLTPKGCIADSVSNPDNCGRTAKGLDDPDEVAVSDDGRSVYVTAYDSDAITLFKRSRTTGKLTPKGCIAERSYNPAGCARTAPGGLDEPYHGSIVVSSDGKFVYTTGSAGPSIARFKRNRTTGRLTPKGCIADSSNNPEGCGQTTDVFANPYVVALSSDGRSAYAADPGDRGIVRFKRNRNTGALIPKGCIADSSDNPNGCGAVAPGLDGAQWVEVSEDGRSVYVAGQNASAIVRFNRNRTTGALKPKGCVADPANNPSACGQTAIGLDVVGSFALSDDGRSLYAASYLDNAIVLLRRQR
jgi:6-phosphogluconolactonase (cycloisomerase 2 family)